MDFYNSITKVRNQEETNMNFNEKLIELRKSKEFIKSYVEQYYNLDFDYEELKKNYYFNETCQETVPQAIFCFLISIIAFIFIIICPI